MTLAYELKARYGKSRMYDAVQKGLDLHTFFSLYRAHEIDDLDLDTLDEDACAAIKERGKKYKETKEGKRSRQLSKCCNFGKQKNICCNGVMFLLTF